MKAVVITEFGGPEVLHLDDQDVPTPGDRAAGVNPLDATICSGSVQEVFPTTLPAVLGQEVAGTVGQVGPGARAFAVGDEVLGFANSGAYAEYAHRGRHAGRAGLGTRRRPARRGRDGGAGARPAEGERRCPRDRPGRGRRVLDATGQGVLPDSIELRGRSTRIVTIADPAAFPLGIRASCWARTTATLTGGWGR